MNNPFKYSNTNKRYYSYDYYLKNKYNSKVAKIGLDAGFTCPNRDGKVSYGGCIFCSDGARSNELKDITDLEEQYQTLKKIMENKWDNLKFIAYFQAFTNTYAEVNKLKEIYEPFINKEEVVGLAIATRCDALDIDVLDYLEDIAKRIPYLLNQFALFLYAVLFHIFFAVFFPNAVALHRADAAHRLHGRVPGALRVLGAVIVGFATHISPGKNGARTRVVSGGRGLDDLLLGGVKATVEDIILNGCIEKINVLLNDTDISAKRCLGYLLYASAVYLDIAL